MDWIVPMEPLLTPSVPDGEDYVHQVKWDGIRGLCYIKEGGVRVFTKKGRDRTLFYPELAELPGLLKGESAVLDGEIIILNNEMKPTFQLSLIRERVTTPAKVSHYARKYPIQYIVFDLMALNGEPLIHKPLKERSILLREHVKTGSFTAVTDDFDNGSELFLLMKEKGWEGIVSKKKNSLYLPGKTHHDWFKTKLFRRILSIVAGVTLREGYPNALVLAILGAEGLVFIGKASIGLTQQHFKLLKDNISILKSDPPSIEKTPLFTANARELRDVVWFKPQLTVWVSFLEWTSDGGIRHPKILGFTSSGIEEANGKEYVE